MFKSKYFYSIIITAIFFVSTIVAQEIPEIKKVYTDEADITIIIEIAKGNAREYKLISLEYIKDMLENRNRNFYKSSHVINIIYEALEYLAFEGTVNTSITDNTINDFPDIRHEAVKLLGQLGIIEARTALIEVLKYENDASVLHEAIRALFLNWSDFYRNNNEINVIINAIEKIAEHRR
jgi:hypothetical protein